MLFWIIQLAVLLLGVAYLVHSYSDKNVQLHIRFLSFLAWLLSFGVVFLIPLDIYWTLENQNNQEYCESAPNKCTDEEKQPLKEYELIVQIWRCVYWITQFLTWVVLPFFQDYEAAGEFTILGKAKKSLKTNLIVLLIVGAIGLVFIVYLLATGSISWDNLQGFLIGLANAFGIFLVVILLGHGLVKIPKKFWRERNEDTYLKHCYFEGYQIDEEIDNFKYSLEDKVQLVLLAKERYRREFQDQLDMILENVPSETVEYCKEQRKPSEQVKRELNNMGNLTLEKLIVLNKEIKNLVSQLKRKQAKWEALINEAFFSQDVLASKNSENYSIESAFAIKREGIFGSCIDIIQWFIYCKVKRICYVIFAAIFCLLSLLILIGEVSIFSWNSINPFTYILDDDHNDYFLTQVFVFIPIMYLSFCVYSSMFQFKLSGLYGLYKLHQTDAPSLMFFSINFSRVSVAISYNYLRILGVENSAFEKILGVMNDVPIFGSANTYFFPSILILLVIFNALDLYSKILGAIGLKQFEFTDTFDDERIGQGCNLVQKGTFDFIISLYRVIDYLWEILARKQLEKKFLKMREDSDKEFFGYNTASALREKSSESFGKRNEQSPSKPSSAEVESQSGSTTSSFASNSPIKNQKNQGRNYSNFSNFEEIDTL